MNRNEAENELDLLALLNHLRRKVWLILAVTAVFAVLGMLYSLLLIVPEYTASTRIYVLNRSREDSVVSSDFQSSSYMVYDYRELITGRNVTGEVIKQLGLNMSSAALSQKISVVSPQNTRILQINVTDTDPVRAQQIANAVREIASAQLTKIMQVDSVTTIYEANIPGKSSSPNITRNTGLAAVVGFVLILGVLVVVFIVDDRIRTEDDVERYLGLSIMGVIPDNEKLSGTAVSRRILGKSPRRSRGIRQWK